MTLFWPIIFLVFAWDGDQALPDLEDLFLQNDGGAFRQLLSDDLRVETDLRPLLNDRGALSRPQLQLAFRKLQNRFKVKGATITNSQSDTNYAWLEIYVELALESKSSGLTYTVTFAFHFKAVGPRLAISRWVLQDLS